MRKSTIVVIFLAVLIVMFALAGFVFSFLWNLVMPGVFNAPHLSWGAGIIIALLLSFIGSVFKK